MIADAVDGKIDLILTKSISRFGRNIVDILDNLNVLSALTPPVSVEFETEHITYTGDGKNNLLIVLLSALAEMESQQKARPSKRGFVGEWPREFINSLCRIHWDFTATTLAGWSLNRPKHGSLSISTRAVWKEQCHRRLLPH